jgi:pilus assembly protein Flp/PilA
MHCSMPSTKLRRFLSAQDGTTAIEYSIIAAGIGIALIGAFTAFGDALVALWTRVATALV